MGATSSPVGEPLPVTDGGQLEGGVTYAYLLLLHCGIDYLGQFNGLHWYRDQNRGSPAPETGAGEAPPQHWPVDGESVIGFVELVAADRIEYSIPPAEVIAEYEPSDRTPPGCD